MCRLGDCALDVDVDKTSLSQTAGECRWIHRDTRIAGVQLAPFGSIDAVDADKQSTWTQHQISPIERPGQDFLPDCRGPLGTRAQMEMALVHDG
jgi:hypothetical protein